MPRIRQPPHPLLSTTYQLHCLSPLYRFPTLNPSEHPSANEQSAKKRNQSPFKVHERTLTNILKGEVLRGVNVAAGDAGVDEGSGELGKLGRFKGCKWRLVPTLAALREYNVEEALRDDRDDEEDDGDVREIWVKAVRERRDVAGVEVSFEYERGLAVYVAYLIGSPHNQDGEFTHLPLVLTRLPRPLVRVLFEYLAATFDTLPTSMGVVESTGSSGGEHGEPGVGWLSDMLEMYVDKTRGSVDKDIALTYRIPTLQGGGVKMITVGLEKGDIDGFLNYGMALALRVTRGGKKRKREDVGEERKARSKGPFLLAVEKHMESSMSLDVNKLVLTKIACGGFVVGGGPGVAAATSGDGNDDTIEHEATEPSGRVKIFVPRKGRTRDVDDSADEDDADGRSGEEAAIDSFVDELIQLAVRKRVTGDREKRGGGEGIGISNGKKAKPATGKFPRGRIEIF